MNTPSKIPVYFIGWDVGGWNCDKNKGSRDAVVILDGDLNIRGHERGNLRKIIAESGSSAAWIHALFRFCGVEAPEGAFQTIMAIDAPLGLPEALVALATARGPTEPNDIFGENAYLFRETDRYLYRRGAKPLSTINDMIGSQAAKAMHAVAKFTTRGEQCGVWKDGERLTMIETYPAPCKHSYGMIADLLERIGSPLKGDLHDALVCALVAHVFGNNPESLLAPWDSVPTSEGWIWLPDDTLAENRAEFVETIAEKAARRITRQTIAALRKITEALASGDDSGLKNAWEGVCVQIQGEQSIFWDAYEEMVSKTAEVKVMSLAPHEREAIWLQTPAARVPDIEGDSLHYPYPVQDGEIVTYLIKDYIYPEAGRYHNSRIRKFLAL